MQFSQITQSLVLALAAGIPIASAAPVESMHAVQVSERYITGDTGMFEGVKMKRGLLAAAAAKKTGTAAKAKAAGAVGAAEGAGGAGGAAGVLSAVSSGLAAGGLSGAAGIVGKFAAGLGN